MNAQKAPDRWIASNPSQCRRMDIGADKIVITVPSDRDPEPVRAFRTITLDLQTLVVWLVACRIDTMATVVQRVVQSKCMKPKRASQQFYMNQ
jgi:hypothetical protein